MRSLVLTLLVGFGISSAVAQTTTATTNTRSFDFPPVGLGSTETAEIDVVNAASNSSSGTAASCTGSLSFLGATGSTLGTSTTFTVTAGQSFSAKLPFTASGGTAPRTVIRGVVTRTIPTSTSSSTANPPCSLQFTMSVYDTTTGATHAVLTGSGLQSGGGGHD